MFALDRGDGPGLDNLLRSVALLHRAWSVRMGNVGTLPQFEPLRALAASPELDGRVFVLPECRRLTTPPIWRAPASA